MSQLPTRWFLLHIETAGDFGSSLDTPLLASGPSPSFRSGDFSARCMA